MQRINVNVRPSSGYVFTDTDGSSHRSKNWALVVQKVREYRERQGKTSDTTEADVMAQACTRYPSLCRPPKTDRPAVDGMPPNAPARPQPAMSLKTHVLMWMDRLMKRKQARNTIEYVKPEEAVARRDICRRCPFNVPFIIPGCGSCKTITGEYRDQLLTRHARHTELGGCLLLGVDLVTAVNLDEVRVDNAALPAACWRKISV